MTWFAGGIAIILIFLAVLQRALRRRRVPSLDDATFAAYFSGAGAGYDGREIANHRRFIAKNLGVPRSKIRPTETLGSVVEHFDYFGDVTIGLNDLRDELAELSAEVGEVAPRVERETTVAEVVDILMRLQAKRREIAPAG